MNQDNRRCCDGGRDYCASRVVEFERERFLKQVLSDEESLLRQREHAKILKELQEDRLSRTIFVTNVKNMLKAENLRGLRDFFHRRSKYGVEHCWVTNYAGQEENPIFDDELPVRVRFTNKIDGQKVLGQGENSLIGLLSSRLLVCEFGTVVHDNKRKIVVQPSHMYPEIFQGTRTSLELQTEQFSLGHWFPWEDDSFRAYDTRDQGVKDLWLQQKQTQLAPKLVLDFGRRLIEIAVARNIDDNGQFTFDNITDFLMIPFASLSSRLELCRDRFLANSDYFALTFSLQYPPRIESAVPVAGLGHIVGLRDRIRRHRYAHIPADEFGTCLGYRFLVSRKVLDEKIFGDARCFAMMKDYGLIPTGLNSVEQARTIDVAKTVDEDHFRALELVDRVHTLFPKIGFQLRILLDNGRMSAYHALRDKTVDGLNIFDSILHILRDHPATSHQILEYTLDLLAGGRTRFPAVLFNRLFRAEEKKTFRRSTLPSYFYSIPRLVLTPCRLAVQRFEVEEGNFLIHRFFTEEGFSRDSFIRLHVSEEDGSKLYKRDLVDSIVNKLSTVIESGVTLNGRKYEVIGCSPSQLKEGALWMVAPERGWTIDRIRFGLGDFSKCRSLSVYMMRFGQFLSSTIRGLHMMELRVSEVDDIACCFNKRTMYHSDGNGMISREAANLLLSKHPHSPDNLEDVSIIQIRTGGVKGTLSVWNTLEGSYPKKDHLEEPNVLVRKQTMVKFSSPYSSLEVCSIGKHAPYFLNRNVIMLLCSHGVKHSEFLKMQKEMIADLDDMLVNGKTAIQVIRTIRVVYGKMRSTILEILELGFSPAKEPFLLSCLIALRTELLSELLQRARIFVPKGAVLMGGLDVTGSLPEGCVFVQVRKDAHSDYEPLVGPVLVTKHPVMHPGDTRMMLAVDLRVLHQHRNVILFSRHGDRPQADKTSGSDLDGDEYAITWDQRLFLSPWNKCKQNHDGSFAARLPQRDVPQQKSKTNAKSSHSNVATICLSMKNFALDAATLDKANSKPMDYTPRRSRNSTSIPTETKEMTSALTRYFFEYAKHDNLGRIGMLWQDYAGRYGAGCAECLELARLHSVAVDYAKSGVPAKIPEKLLLSGKAPRAHWRGFRDVPSFYDNGIIGKLYDMAVEVRDKTPSSLNSVLTSAGTYCLGQILSSTKKTFSVTDLLEIVYDKSIVQLLAPKGLLESALEFAQRLRIEYDTEITALMNFHGILSEGEIATGCIHKFQKRNKRRQHDLVEEIGRSSKAIRLCYRFYLFREVLKMSRFVSFAQHDNVAGRVFLGNDESDTPTMEMLEWVEKAATGRTRQDFNEWSAASARYAALQLVAACYEVTYSPKSRLPVRESREVFFGFPWLFSDIIAQVMKEPHRHL